jgi:cellulose synthase/poly-beta-1,6-N-acetylglucosamine synthase-like glycosyltransferase
VLIALYLFYGVLVLISAGNLLLMRCPRQAGDPCFEVMIPARNEAENIQRVLTPLIEQGAKVTVFDDDSSDGTGEIAQELGATVVTPCAPLPEGWTGKNNACHQLSQNAESEWVVFLDADTHPKDGFVQALSGHLCKTDAEVVTGFARMLPGAGLEPAYLGWVPWILLATNPFGLVAATGKGHNRFTNGQFVAWRRSVLSEVRPFETMQSEILEDVKIGRLLAQQGRKVDVLNVSEILEVQMYRTLSEAFRGMCKNSADIVGSSVGSYLFAAFLLLIAWGWLIGGIGCYALLVLSKALTDRITKFAPWTALLIPLTISAAAVTIVVSELQKGKGSRTWKGRTYP